MKTLKNLLRSGLFIATFLTFASIAYATDFTVNTLDFGDDNSTCDVTKCTINEAVDAALADAGPGPNRVIFDPTLSGGTITFTETLTLDGDFPDFTIFANNDITLTHVGATLPDTQVIFQLNQHSGNITIDGLNFLNGATEWGNYNGLGVISITATGASTVTIQNSDFTIDTCADGQWSKTAIASRPGSLADVVVDSNTVSGAALFYNGATDIEFTITNNDVTNACDQESIHAAAGYGTISGNTIYFDIDETAGGFNGAIRYHNFYIQNDEYTQGASETGTVTISNNEIYQTSAVGQPTGISIFDGNRSLSFAITNNTIRGLSNGKVLYVGISIESGNDINISNNQIALTGDNGGNGIALRGHFAGIQINNATIDHNTIYAPDSNSYPTAINIGQGLSGDLSIENVSVTNNIFDNTSFGISLGYDEPTAITNFTNDHNIFFNTDLFDKEERGEERAFYIPSESLTLGANSTYNIDPALADPENFDFTLLPYSYAIGFADDSSDAGAEDYDGARTRTTIYVDDDGVIDHETPDSLVDYNDIQSAIYAAAPTGDTILVAAGTYTETSDLLNKALTLTGEDKATTIIDADEDEIAMTMSSDSTVSNFTIQNTTALRGYDVEFHTYDYDGNTYDDGGEGGVPTMLFAVAKSTPADPENDFDFIAEEGDTASNIGENLNLGLVSGPDIYFTMYFRDSLYPDQTTTQEYLDEFEMGLTIDKWFPDTFIYSGGTFTFTDPETIDETVTLTAGYETPAISNASPGEQGGLYFADISGTSISNLNIDTHGVGLYFTGDSLTNTVLNVIFSNISICDVFSNATGTNSVNGEDVVEELCITVPEPEDTDVTAPVGLTALTLGSRTTSSVTLSWTQVVEENFNHYEIWYGTNATDTANRNGTAAEWDADTDATLSTISTTSTTVTGLSSATQYYFKIWAVDDSNNEETVAALSVTTSSSGRSSSSSSGSVITTTESPETDTTPTVDTPAPTVPSVTEIAETIVTVTDTVRTDMTTEEAQQEAVAAVSDLIAEILTSDIVDEITSLETSEESSASEDDTTSPYTPEDLAILTNPNSDLDGDGVSNADEIAAGTDPLRNNDGTIEDLFTPPSEETDINSAVGALKVLGIGDEGFVVSGTTTPESDVEVHMTNSKGYSITLKTTSDINGNYILPISITDELTDGSLLIKATNEEGQSDVVLAKFKETTLKKPTLTFEGEKVIEYKDLTLRELIALIEASEEYSKTWTQNENVYQLSSLLGQPIEKKIAFKVERAGEPTVEGGRIIVRGKTDPGATVILAYKSVIYSSVVIADKNGNFTSELPKDLKEELAKDPNATEVLHEFIVFAMDYKKNEASAFNKGQFKLMK